MSYKLAIGQGDTVIRRHSQLGLLSLEQNRGSCSVLLWLSRDLQDGGVVGGKDLGAFGP